MPGSLFELQQQSRFMRPDGIRWIRPDIARFLKPGSAVSNLDVIQRKYSPNQPRAERGRWTDQTGALTKPTGHPDIDVSQDWSNIGEGEADQSITSEINNGTGSMFDVDPDAIGQPGDEIAQNRRVGGLSTQFPEATPAQMLRLGLARSEADTAIGHVREVDPSWQPSSSLYQSVEGAISAAQGEAVQAQARINQLAQQGVGPGPYAVGSIPARGVSRNFSAEETRENNMNGDLYGCHTCGSSEPGTLSGNWVRDHQYPSALNYSQRPQRIYPQCVICSAVQGGFVSSLKGWNK